MITVVGMWEQGYTLEQMFIEDTVWKQTLNAYAVDRFCMVTADEIVPGVSSPEQFASMEEALATTTGERVFLVFSGAEGATLLPDFNHPTDAVYIFGRPGNNLSSYIQPGDHRVHIETPAEIDMLACSCVAAVLYARNL